MNEQQAATIESDQPVASGSKVRAAFACSFCGKKQHQVWRLIAGPGVYICSECILLCVEMLIDGSQADLDDPDVFRVATRREDGTVEQLSFGPLPEPGIPTATTPGGVHWLYLCPICGTVNVGSELDTCLHCAAPLPRPGEQPVERPRTPWHVGFSRSELRSFAPALRTTLELAQEEAAHLRHDYIGTEHLLLGLLRQEDNPAATTLTAQGVTVEAVRQAVGEIMGAGKAEPAAVKGYSQRGREVVRSALALAKQRDQTSVGPEHLLLALLQERMGVAALTLTALGVDMDGMQRQMEQRLSLAAPTEPPTAEDRP